MCHQTVGLIQKTLEENNIICSKISIINEITTKLGIKRYLSVPYNLGFPLGKPNDYIGQKYNIRELLQKTIK